MLSDATNHFDNGTQDHFAPEGPSIDGNDKLLSLNLPTYNFTLLDYSLRRTALSLTAQLHGMFFVAETPRAVSADPSLPPNELTCYRRNLFQITGSITLPRTLRYVLTERGDRIPILAQELAIAGTESVEGNPIKVRGFLILMSGPSPNLSSRQIISVPWKSPAASSTPEEKTEKEPTSIPLDTMSNQDMDADYATFPVAWKRLQFRIATANNGRRKELQQHFVVRLKVMATLSTGAKVSICEAMSNPIIVRGRSPRNFVQRKDYPVGGSGSSMRKAMQPPAGLTRSISMESGQSHVKDETSPELPLANFRFDSQDSHNSATFIDTNKSLRVTGGAFSSLPSPSFDRSPVVNAGHTPTSPTTPTISPTIPQILSLSDDTEASTPRSKIARTGSNTGVQTRPSASARGSYSAADHPHGVVAFDAHDSADLLYEYFPLGLDDWMPPVDAVYRPHVVHHTNLPQATPLSFGRAKAGYAGAGKSKRYFSEAREPT